MEFNASSAGNGVIVVSGASPYGDYSPMTNHEYYSVPLNGEKLVVKTITAGLAWALVPDDMTMIYLAAGIGLIVIIVVVVVIMKKR